MNPDPIITEPVIRGAALALREMPIRTIVEASPLCGVTLVPSGRLKTLATNKSAPALVAVSVISQGPLMFALVHVSATAPLELSTMRQPAGLTSGNTPPVPEGRLPTTTHPPGRIDSAVVRPTPPGQRSDVGNDE